MSQEDKCLRSTNVAGRQMAQKDNRVTGTRREIYQKEKCLGRTNELGRQMSQEDEWVIKENVSRRQMSHLRKANVSRRQMSHEEEYLMKKEQGNGKTNVFEIHLSQMNLFIWSYEGFIELVLLVSFPSSWWTFICPGIVKGSLACWLAHYVNAPLHN